MREYAQQVGLVPPIPLEELSQHTDKLIAIHGDTYRRYRERVPGLLPLPWKYLRSEEAKPFT